mgnify:FL=1
MDLSRLFAGIPGRGSRNVEPTLEEKARVFDAVHALPVVLFEFDANGDYVCAAGDYLKLFGITPTSVIGRSVYDFPKFVPGKKMVLRKALAGEKATLSGIWPLGRYMIQFIPRFDAQRRVKSVVGFGYDIAKPSSSDTHFEELLEALRQSEARFRAMCDCAPLGIVVSNPRLELNYINPALCELLQRQQDELLGHGWELSVHPDERWRITRARAAGSWTELEGALHLVRKDGASVWVSLSLAAMRDDGDLTGYVGVMADITQEYEARIAIDRAQRDLRRVIESSPEGIAVVRDQRWIFVNRALAEALGYPDAEALIGRDATELVHAEDHERALCLGAALEGEANTHEIRYRRASGDYVLLELRPALLTAFEGAPAVLLSARDVTEHRKLQARLLVTERLLSVGTLAAGVAHEINNPLAAVLTTLEWLSIQLNRMQDSNADDTGALQELRRGISRLIKPVEEARDASGRVRAIVNDLKLFSRADEELQGPVELTQVLDSAVRLAWNELRHRARVVREYSDLPLVRGSEARLGQVFLNLLINAAHAIPEDGKGSHEIRVSARREHAQVVVEITDTGSGIPTDIQARIFDPFFTTKPASLGTGLGLSICQRIVTSVGGQIEVESQLGRGSTFRVTLESTHTPPSDAAAREVSIPARPSAPRGRVLVIDDDPAVGSALKLVLAEDHEVTVLTSARQALAQLGSGENFDAILCDVMMPEMSGIEFHGELAHTQPDLAAQVIFLTGGAFTLRAREFLDRVPNPRLGKPFDWQKLMALINQRLVDNL